MQVYFYFAELVMKKFSYHIFPLWNWQNEHANNKHQYHETQRARKDINLENCTQGMGG